MAVVEVNFHRVWRVSLWEEKKSEFRADNLILCLYQNYASIYVVNKNISVYLKLIDQLFFSFSSPLTG